MNIELIQQNHMDIAVITGTETIITDVDSALDLAMTVRHETGSGRLAIDKKLIAEDFFILSTRLAGEILQKWINYQIKAAVWGDYTRYTSKPLKDFIYESNHGTDFFFTATRQEAIERLSLA